MKTLLESTRLTPEMLEGIKEADLTGTRVEANTLLAPAERTSAALSRAAAGQSLAQLLKRPEVAIEHLAPILKKLMPDFFKTEISSASSGHSAVPLPSQVRNELKSVETEIKYEGYLQQQHRAMERLKKSEQHSIPEWFDYRAVSGLSREMQEKLTKIRPRTLGQASRIPGVTPAAVSLVNVYIEIQARRREQATAL
jgi:tRNA uridine 5-carboxymethylaminomethyl modification enzyme